MSNLYIQEFPGITAEHWQLVKMPPITEQPPIAIGAAAQSQPFQSGTRVIRVFAGASCSILVGTVASNPTATTNNTPLAANQTEFFGVGAGEVLSVIANPTP